jgi:leader peptidase (prepilin peptidase)/N-methyltransferase
MAFAELPLWFVRTFGVAFGLLWGSFLNVVIYRLPQGMSVVRPASRCPHCGTPIRPWDNIPVASWLLLRGKARCCGAKVSPRYPVVEGLSGGLALGVVEGLLRPLPDDTALWTAVALFACYLALCLGLLAAALIDAEHMFLPDVLTLGGTVLGFASCPLRGVTFADSAMGAALGFFGVYVPFIWGYARLRGRPGMGLGDAKLLMLAGAWFAWPGACFVLFAGAVQGTVAAFVMIALHGKIDEPEAVRRDRELLQAEAAAGDEEAKALLAEDPLGDAPPGALRLARLPFGPFLALGCLEWLFFGGRLLPWLGAG